MRKVKKMEKITMNDWEYHCRMLADIAKRNGAALMLYYDPHPNERGCACKALIGSGADAMVMLASMTDTACEGFESIMTPERLSEQITAMIRSVRREREHDK